MFIEFTLIVWTSLRLAILNYGFHNAHHRTNYSNARKYNLTTPCTDNKYQRDKTSSSNFEHGQSHSSALKNYIMIIFPKFLFAVKTLV